MRIGVSGHQELPEPALPFIAQGMAAVLESVQGPITGVSSLAAGADQLFAQMVLECQGNLHVIVPCAAYERTFSRAQDLAFFQDLLERADAIERLPSLEPSREAFLKAGQRVVDLSELLIAVWDGHAARGKGGTADIVAYARERQTPIEILWPPGVER